MNTIKLKKLTIQAFRGFVGVNTVEFPENGLVAIKGYNRNNGGSSGAGKSSIGLAIMYALGLLSNAKRHANKQTQAEMQVTLELDTGHGPVVINRGAVTNVIINGQTISGSVAKVNEAIATVFGMSLDLVEPLIMRYQQQPGFFLSMTDSEKKEFLSKLLGLEQIELAIIKAQESIESAKSGLEVYQKLKVAQPKMEPPLPPTDKSLIKGVEDFKQLDLLEGQYRTEMSSCDENLIDLERQLNQLKIMDVPVPVYPPPIALDEASEENLHLIESLQDSLERSKAMVGHKLAQLKEQLALVKNQNVLNKAKLDQYYTLENELNNLKTKKSCQSCGSAIDDDKVLALKAQYEQQLARLRDTLVQPDYFGNKVLSLETEIAGMVNHVYPELSQLTQAKARQKEFDAARQKAVSDWEKTKAKIDSDYLKLKESHLSNLAALKDRIRDCREHRNKLVNHIDELDRTRNWWVEQNKMVIVANAAAKDAYNKALAAYEKSIQVLDHYDANIKTYLNTIDLETDFIALSKGYLGGIFQELLDEIAVTANGYLAQLSNANTFTVQFSTVKTTQAGVAKNEIKPIVIKSGVAFDRENLSGGQATSLDLAVDLALNKVIRHRVGSGPAWIMLDEAFDGHDSAVKEGCVGLLTAHARSAIVLVVDHAADFNEWFTKQIEVECNGDVSRII
jgi:DNA repair exonuclease SbcCD ATPase subunit